MNTILKILISPFALLFWCITATRNWLYNKTIFKSTEFDIPIICVGNLAVGGSGKTPMVEYLINHLHSDYTIAVLSRGYGRKTKGFKWVSTEDNYIHTGDEPLQIKLKYPKISVAVCEKRVDGVIQILGDKPETNLILLDDAFQHRAIKARISLILSEYKKPFFKDWIMPIGRLRESRNEIKRADGIIFTKCPSDYKKYKVQNIPMFYSMIRYNKPEIKSNVYGFSGLADNSLFEDYLNQNYSVTGFRGFKDHHDFTDHDIQNLKKEANGALLCCTEKDFIKIRKLDIANDIQYITIENYIEGDENFIHWLKNKIEFES